jgi:hypothetical protein
VVWVNNFNTIYFSFYGGSGWSSKMQVFGNGDSIFLNGVTGDASNNQTYTLFTDQTGGTMNVLPVSSTAQAGTSVPLGSFSSGAIAFDPIARDLYAFVQNGLGTPQIFGSSDGGMTFQAGPTLPDFPSGTIINGIAANNDTVAIAYSAGGSEEVHFSSDGGPFGSSATLFTDTMGSFSLNGIGLDLEGNLGTSIIDTHGGSTSLTQVILPTGTTTPVPTTLVSTGVFQFSQPGGGIQLNDDTVFGFLNPNTLVMQLAQLVSGNLTPVILNTPTMNAKEQGTLSIGPGLAVGGAIEGSSTPGNLSLIVCN